MTADELVLSVLLVVGLAIAVAVTHQRGKRYGLNSLDMSSERFNYERYWRTELLREQGRQTWDELIEGLEREHGIARWQANQMAQELIHDLRRRRQSG